METTRRPRLTLRRGRRLRALALSATLLTGGCSLLVPHSNAGLAALEGPRSPVAAVARGAKYAGWILGAPVSLALAPLAALLWATPWVDLPLAVDIASAPALGLGYLSEALVGVPAYAAALPFSDPQPELQPAAKLAQAHSVPWGFVVDHRPLRRHARGAAPVASATLARYAVPPQEQARLAADLRAAATPDAPYEVPLQLGFAATLEVYPAEEGLGPRPLVFMTPPLRATFASRWLAQRFAARGIHAAVVVPATGFLEPSLTPAALEAKLRHAVISGRAALRALRDRPEVDPRRVCYMGISAGAIYGSLLMALEPIQRSVLVFPGGDLPRIVTTSQEPRVVAYREARERVGQPAPVLRAELERTIQTDPLALAPHVDPRRVLVFLGAWDSAVPVETGLELCRALGGPETWILAGDHASAALCFGFVLDQAEAFLLR